MPAGLGVVSKVVGGSSHTMALRSDGAVRCWGSNAWGQTVVPSGTESVIDIAAGQWHSVALKSDGTVVCWGSSDYGQHAVPNTLGRVFRVAGGTSHSVALRADGSVRCWGSNGYGEGVAPANLGVAQNVAASAYHSMALLQAGRVACWGEDGWGQSTVPASLGSATSIGAGANHSLAVQVDGKVIAWGSNGFGECLGTAASGAPIYGTPAGQPLQVRGVVISDATAGAGGDRFTVLLRNGGVVSCLGRNDFGQTVVPSGVPAMAQVVAGDSHVIARSQSGSVRCWGRRDLGQCNVPFLLGTVSDIAAGANHSVALRADGTVQCWGANFDGQCNVPAGLGLVVGVAAGGTNTFAILSDAASSCQNPGGSGNASLAVSGSAWQDLSVWNWTQGSRAVPGSFTGVDLGTSGSVGSECEARCQTLTTRAGTSLLVPSAASAVGNDYSIRVGSTANLAGRLWLLGVSGAGSTLPENLNVPVLSAGMVNGNFDLIQSELPPPPGFFLTLVPEDVNGRTVFSLRLLPLPGGGELTASSTGSFTGRAVAAETIDINHDGFDDLALAVDFGASQNGLIQILLNDGAGGLGSTSVLTSIPPQPTCLAVGDVDGDGDRDVAVGIGSDSTARVYLDNGAGALTASTVYSGLGGSPLSVAIVEGGGSSLQAASGSVVVGTSGSKLKIFVNGALQQEITLAGTPNTTRPGKNDIIRPTGINTGGTRTASIDGLLPVAETGFVQTFTLAPSGMFELGQTMFITAKPVAMDCADLDGDGLDDIVTTNTEPQLPAVGSALPVLSIFRNSGGTFGGGVPYQPANASSGLDVSLIDVDNDGDRDIVSVYRRVGSDSEAALLRVDTLGPGTPISIGQTTVLDASDPILSARGNLDGTGGEDLFLVNQPSGSFLTGAQEVKPFVATGGLKQGDLDGDGTVGASDISILLLDFGPCPGCASDLDRSGEVDGGDLSFLLLLFD
ncbi:MAG: RCC1 domain-containing protein [Phycisphaerales bacterium]